MTPKAKEIYDRIERGEFVIMPLDEWNGIVSQFTVQSTGQVRKLRYKWYVLERYDTNTVKISKESWFPWEVCFE